MQMTFRGYIICAKYNIPEECDIPHLKFESAFWEDIFLYTYLVIVGKVVHQQNWNTVGLSIE